MQNINQHLIKISKKLVFISVSIALYLNANPAKAILNINIFDDGPDLKVVTSGTLSELGNQVFSQNCGANGVLLSPSIICTGVDTPSPLYSITGLAGFGGTASLSSAASVFGPFFVLATSGPFGQIYAIDPSYVTGQPFLSSATFSGTSLASQGFTVPGLVGTWSIDGTSESINLIVGPPAEVPGPLPLFGAAAAYGWSRRIRRRITAPVRTPPQA
ncbi:MAG: hypothetical protein KFB97_01295 [Cyanobium sp. M30B3]|nr:MAG: hypothetical protein KFB97_01295 [Cyanobium sp. M30B3]